MYIFVEERTNFVLSETITIERYVSSCKYLHTDVFVCLFLKSDIYLVFLLFTTPLK